MKGAASLRLCQRLPYDPTSGNPAIEFLQGADLHRNHDNGEVDFPFYASERMPLISPPEPRTIWRKATCSPIRQGAMILLLFVEIQ